MTMTMKKTIITKIIIVIMMRMKKALKQNKKCSTKSNSYLLKMEKRLESHKIKN